MFEKTNSQGKMGNVQSVNPDVCDELCEHNTDRKMEEKRTKCGSSTNRRKTDEMENDKNYKHNI